MHRVKIEGMVWKALGGIFFWITSVLLVVLVTVILAYQFNFRKTIVPRIYISNIEVSGMTAEKASDLIIAKIKNEGVEVVLTDNFGRVQELNTKELNINYLVPETVTEAWQAGRSGNLIDDVNNRVSYLISGRNIPLRANHDESVLETMVASIAASIDQKPISPAIKVLDEKSSRIEITQGKDGWVVDQGKLISDIKTSLGQIGRREIALSINHESRSLSEEEITAIDARAKELLNKEIKLKTEGFEERLKGKQLVALIGFKTKWNEEGVNKVTQMVGDKLNRLPQDAKFEFTENKLVDFQPDMDGRKVDEPLLAREISSALENNLTEVNIPLIKTPAKIRAGEINDLGIVELLGEGKSSYGHSIPGRVHNVALAASRINGVLVAPGEEFSFNDTVGDISAATGYKSAYIIQDGRTVLGDGGGVCQVSTTLFRAVLNAGLPVVERHPHAYRVSYYEQDSKPGVDATVFSPSVDFRFKNDTDKHILVQMETDSKNLRMRVGIYGSKDGRKVTMTEPKIFSQSPPPDDLYIDDPSLNNGVIRQIDYKAWGAKVGFDYKVEKGDQVIFQKSFYSNYRPWQAVFLRGTKIN